MIRMIQRDDADWPAALNEVGLPETVWVRGDVSVLTGRTVSIIGSRACTAYGQHVAGDLGYGLADKGVAVVTGGAFGIDAAATRGTLMFTRKAIVVLACGIDVPYPGAHGSLFDEVVRAGGLIVSEYKPGTFPTREHFLSRNRIVAALGAGAVLVEATERSGSRAAFRHARQLGRRLMAVPGPVTSVQSLGVLDELRRGDVVPVANASDVVTATFS